MAGSRARVQTLAVSITGLTPTTRTIATTAPLTGGGDLSANRTLAVSAATSSAVGVVELATDGEYGGVVPTGDDSRLEAALVALGGRR